MVIEHTKYKQGFTVLLRADYKQKFKTMIGLQALRMILDNADEVRRYLAAQPELNQHE